MIAEINKKLRDTGIERLEDELTGNFFGNIRYLSFNKGLKQILKNCIYPKELSEAFECVDADDWSEKIIFWPKYPHEEKWIEPDVLLDFDDITIFIEVKYNSGLSSDDDVDNSLKDDEHEREHSANQLARQARLLERIAGNKKKLLILMAQESSVHQIYTDVKNRNLLGNVAFGYITWQKVFDALKIIECTNSYEKVILDDLAELLRTKGFEGFRNFMKNYEEVDVNNIWAFEQGVYNMNLGENIYNAFDIVIKTQDNVSKFIEYCHKMTKERDEYEPSLKKALFYKPQDVVLGYMMLFQHKKDTLLESGWRDGPIYLLSIYMYVLDVYKEPMVEVAKCEYADISSWIEGWSQSEFWRLHDPLYLPGYVEYEMAEDNNFYTGCVVDEQVADKRFWGLRKISGFSIPLTEITNDNAYEKVFGNFRILADK